MIASARSAYILKRLAECSIIDYKNISKELNVSEATVRRDFEKLEQKGKLRRVQGGAVINEENPFGELSILAKANVHSAEKHLVAEAAAECVEDGESIFLDCGTSIAPLGKILLKKKINIVTNNNLIIQQAGPDSNAQIFVIGGNFMPDDQMFIGPMAESMISNYTFNKAFMGCMGVSIESDSVFVTDMACLVIKQLAMKNSKENFLLLDSSKLNKQGLFKMAGLSDFESVYINESNAIEKYPENFIAVK